MPKLLLCLQFEPLQQDEDHIKKAKFSLKSNVSHIHLPDFDKDLWRQRAKDSVRLLNETAQEEEEMPSVEVSDEEVDRDREFLEEDFGGEEEFEKVSVSTGKRNS